MKYDLLGEIAEKTQLIRRTVAAILRGVSPSTFAKFRLNPEQFITEAARLINEQKATVIVEHLAYDALEDQFDSAIFTDNQTAQDFSKAGLKLKKHVYDYVVTDSKIERAFVTELDTSKEVAVYAKLRADSSSPPVGDYNYDWAIAFTEGSVKHVYFVAETKGSLSTLQLKGVEDAKIECARKKFFASLSERNGNDVTYDVVTDYTELMQPSRRRRATARPSRDWPALSRAQTVLSQSPGAPRPPRQAGRPPSPATRAPVVVSSHRGRPPRAPDSARPAFLRRPALTPG